MRTMRAATVLGMLLAAAASAPAVARANDAIEQARRYYDDAAFDAALGALVRAEAGGGLERADVIELLALRALVHFALGNAAQVDADLRRLAAVDSAHRFGNDAPPDFQRRWESIRTDEVARVAPREPIRPEPTTPPRERTGSARTRASDDEGGSATTWILLGSAAAIVVGVIVVVLLATSGPSDDTQVAAPTRIPPAL